MNQSVLSKFAVIYFCTINYMSFKNIKNDLKYTKKYENKF